MIKNIYIKNVATYDQEGAHLKGLKKINYIYGSNGSGKTTISEYLRSGKQDKYIDCLNDSPSENYNILVYNRNFVAENFREHSSIKGIFTLGKQSKDLLEKIEQYKKDRDKHESRLETIKKNTEETKEDVKRSIQDFQKRSWELKIKYDEDFKEAAFKGLRNNKEKFMEKCIQEADNERELKTYDEIINKKESIFNKNQEKMMYYNVISLKEEVEKKEIFHSRIVGKEDLDIADLISHLNISDWVKEGHKHMKNSDGICPFCQQDLPMDFEKQLENYFDTTYTYQINQLNTGANKYIESIEDIILQIKQLTNEKNQFLDRTRIEQLLKVVESTFSKNQLLVEQKKKEPSREMQIISISSEVKEINEEIKKANNKIKSYNNVMENLREEKEELAKDIWRYIVEQNKPNYQQYKREIDKLRKRDEGLKVSFETQTKYHLGIIKEINKAEKQITSVETSVREINNYLQKFGYSNFKLATTHEKGNYKIIRVDGQDVEDTLSEGEKTFITFLYFYFLLRGSNDTENISAKKIVAIDDPISSLDSNILFVVSNLIRQIIEEIRNNSSNVKQLFIFTHNVYFHKEVTFSGNKAEKANDNETFWIIRKTNNVSETIKCEKNPIKSSYELLWNELKLIKDHNLITTQNVMRRILETYFNFFGGFDIRQEIEKFEGDEKIIGRTLLFWANDGSHHINEDLEVERSAEQAQKYFSIFRNIFFKMGHHNHFEMMTRDFPVDDMFPSKAGEKVISNQREVITEIEHGREQVASSLET